MAATAFPNYTKIPSRLPVAGWQTLRVGSLVGGLTVAALLLVAEPTGPVRLLEGRHPGAAAAVDDGAGAVAQPLPAGRLQPDAARARDHARADRSPTGCKEYGYVIAISLFLVLVVAAQARARRQRAAQRAAAARRDGRRLRRRPGPQGQERLVLDDLPAAAACSASTARRRSRGRQQPLPAVRRLREELLRLQPEGRLPRRPQRRPVLGRLPQALRRRASRASSIAFFTTPDHPATSVGGDLRAPRGSTCCVSAGSFLVLDHASPRSRRTS